MNLTAISFVVRIDDFVAEAVKLNTASQRSSLEILLGLNIRPFG